MGWKEEARAEKEAAQRLVERSRQTPGITLNDAINAALRGLADLKDANGLPAFDSIMVVASRRAAIKGQPDEDAVAATGDITKLLGMAHSHFAQIVFRAMAHRGAAPVSTPEKGDNGQAPSLKIAEE